MKLIRTVIADDEPRAHKRIEKMLEEYEEFEIIANSSDGKETIKILQKEKPDLVFLDIQMPEFDGFEVLQQLDMNVPPHIIFVTAYDQFALKAFEVNAIDYLLKPFDKERFDEAVSKIKERFYGNTGLNSRAEIEQLLETIENRQEAGGDRVMVKEDGKIFFLEADEIDRIESAGNYIKIITSDNQYMIRETMTNISSKLDSNRFFRVHRSTIVNIDRVKVIEPWFHGDYQVTMYNGEKLNMSRNYKRILEAF